MIRYVAYPGEAVIHNIMKLIEKDLSEPYCKLRLKIPHYYLTQYLYAG